MFLGQVPITPGSGFGNTPIFWPGGFGTQRVVPPGAPRAQEISQPSGWTEDHHCYSCSDGTHRDMTLPEARAVAASGIRCRPVDYRECPGWKAVNAPSTAAVAMAGRRLGQNGGTPLYYPVFPFWL
jgi:hypothetical protein